ncbi:MAG: dihydropteroate synthase [Flavobacteriaceae bacterium]|nr:dihydropteroate synthase [Flavobacteriaceae bacterium]
MKSINCKGTLIDLNSPKVMGILNLTPDSFYDGGKYKSDKEILFQIEKMLKDGATFIDIGAYSSRPGAKNISEETELSRIIPVLKIVIDNFPEILISIDTFRSKVAKQCIAIGASMINDISAGSMDTNMFTTIAEMQVPYIMMHMQGTPQNMRQKVVYHDLIQDIIYYFSKKINQLRNLGVNDLILDVGFGFSKTLDQNYELLHNLNLFTNLNLPILSGLSRKSMLYNYLNITNKEALNATTVVNTVALQQGSNILRVHDVKEAVETIKILKKVK